MVLAWGLCFLQLWVSLLTEDALHRWQTMEQGETNGVRLLGLVLTGD